MRHPTMHLEPISNSRIRPFEKVQVNVGAKDMRTILAIVLFTGLCGCQSLPPSPDAQFRARHPYDARRYELLAPTSVEFIEISSQYELATLSGIRQGIEKRLDSPDELRAYMKTLRKIEEIVDRANDPQWQAFTNRLEPGDALYYYNYRDDKYSEDGLIVLRNGNIVFRKMHSANSTDRNIEDVDQMQKHPTQSGEISDVFLW